MLTAQLASISAIHCLIIKHVIIHAVPDIIFKNLNEKQIAAVKHLNGPALVVAGPGSGKTRVLTHRIAYLIGKENIPETNILCVTFTNKAAKEIKERVEVLLHELNMAFSKLPWSGTFHSICSKILRKEGHQIGINPSFVIYDTDDQLSLIKQIVKDYGIDSKQINVNAVLSAISSAKSELVNSNDYANYAQGYFQRTVAKIYPQYQKMLRKNQALDFDDLLVEVVNLFQANEVVLKKYRDTFNYILVDEYQDTNKAQYVLIKILAQEHENIFVVGDMSQAIYSFRGADFRNILNFQKDYTQAKIYNLEQNYRSTQIILDAAKHVIKNNSTHINLDLWTENKTDEKITLYTGKSDYDEANFVIENILTRCANGDKYSDFAILYRTNAQSRNIEEHLIKSNIPYKIVGGFRFYSRKEVKDIIAFLRVIYNPKDTVSWERVINVPPRGIGKKSIENLKSEGWNLDDIENKTKLPFKHWVEIKDTLATIELMDEVIDKTKYLQWLDDGTEESLSRIENIKELRSVANSFTNLNDFLENVALIESTNKVNVDTLDAVTLMTVHASKGLEFKTVFIIGLEEGLFPHTRALTEQMELEEERRLCYVAITRAKNNLYLTHTTSRMYFGRVENNFQSRFISEIPQELVKHIGVKNNANMSQMINDYLDEMEVDRRNFSWD